MTPYSKYEIYTTVQSIYCYKGSSVLKNRFHIREQELLLHVERELVSAKQMMLLQTPLKGRYTKTHLLRIHKFLFGDLYSFAGHYRREQISKGDTVFYPPNMIPRALDSLFHEIENTQLLFETDFQKQIQHLSYVMAELNAIHPFREGNGRCIREFIRCISLHSGFSLQWSLIDPETLIQASIASIYDSSAFMPHLTRCAVSPVY